MMVPGTAAAHFADNALLDANVPDGVMTQLARRARLHNVFAPQTLAGLQALDPSCPASAPYAVPGWPGRCSNVEAMGVSNPTNPVVEYAGAPITDTGISQQNAEARFGLQLTLDRATQESLAREAEAQGRAQGYTVSCQVVENYAPAMPGTPGYLGYSTQCSINGGPFDQSAALLIRPGGWAIARVESHLPASTYNTAPVTQAPAPNVTGTQASQSQGGGNTAQPQTATSPSGPGGIHNPVTQPWPSATYSVPSPSGPSSPSAISSLLDQPMILVGLAAVAFFMMRGK